MHRDARRDRGRADPLGPRPKRRGAHLRQAVGKALRADDDRARAEGIGRRGDRRDPAPRGDAARNRRFPAPAGGPGHRR